MREQPGPEAAWLKPRAPRARHVPEQYTLLRTPAADYFPPPLFNARAGWVSIVHQCRVPAGRLRPAAPAALRGAAAAPRPAERGE